MASAETGERRRAVVIRASVITAALSALALGLFAFIGGWTRRWISDDGLIVLRTVRNILAGNGPVFNAGERVETNTSTLWQYAIALVAKITGAQLEIIAMWLALLFTTAALVIAAIATSRLYTRKSLILVPVGGLVYLAPPPARDFATSGLEWGLSLLWLAVFWLLLVNWVRAVDKPEATAGRHRTGSSTEAVTLWLAFWCGLSWLVRPELALYGGLAGILLLITAHNWRVAGGILAVALPIPAGYQIFRMGYYGLLTPHTAVAKSADAARWGEGWTYVLDYAAPYLLFVALALVAALAALLLLRLSRRSEQDVSDSESGVPEEAADTQGKRMRLRSRPGIIGLMVLAATVHLLYVIRVGGDFMHGRMILLPLFALLLPVMVMPLVDIVTRQRSILLDVLTALGFAGLLWWTTATIGRGHPVDWEDEFESGPLGIVDEREFWSNATERNPGDPPLTAEDFLPARALGDWEDSVEETMTSNGALMIQYLVSDDPAEYSWYPAPRMEAESDLNTLAPTSYLTNLGMTGMNSPLNMRVLDTVGLSSPLAARQPRDPDGRIGHDKSLDAAWRVADSDMNINEVPEWYDREEALLARAALRTPDFVELFESYRAPMTPARFLDNIGFALTDGRTLELSDDPRDHLDDETIAEIEEYVEVTANSPQSADPQEVPATTGPRIAWRYDTATD